MSMSVPAFAANVPEQTVNQTQETVCVTMAGSADNLTATETYIAQNASSTNSKIDILGDEHGGSVTRGSTAPTTLWDWSDGDYEGSCLPLYRGRGVYTNYKFKPTAKKLTVDLDMYADEDWTENRKLTVTLYKKAVTRGPALVRRRSVSSLILLTLTKHLVSRTHLLDWITVPSTACGCITTRLFTMVM